MKNNLVIAILCATIASSCITSAVTISATSHMSDQMQIMNSRMMEEIQRPVMEPVSTNYIYAPTTITVESSNNVSIGADIPTVEIEPSTVSAPEVAPIAATTLTEADARMIALIVVGEAEGESEYGQRLVADTILNRIDSMQFPDTVNEVVRQPGQYSCVWNGRLNRCKVTDDICNMVQEEAANRTNEEVIFFRTGHYGYGKPLFQEGHHYFCGLNV